MSSFDEDFSRAVEDGLHLSKRIGAAAPRLAGGMDRSQESFLPAAPMVYAVIVDPASVDSPDAPSYQPYVYGYCDPPALIPLQMKEIAVEVDCLLDETFVTVRGRWWVHCVSRSRSCDCRLVIPIGEEGSILGVEFNIGRRSYATRVIEAEDQIMENIGKTEVGGFLKPQLFSLTIPQIDGGSDILFTIKWSQKLLYADGQFSVDIPLSFPNYVNPFAKIYAKKEKIQLNVNSGIGKEVFLQRASHALKEQSRQGGKLTFLYDAAVESWSSNDFHFSYSVYSGDLFGGILLQSPSVHDYDQRDMFCLFLFPGINQKKKVFRKKVVFLVDASGSMLGKPLENIKNAISSALLELVHGDYFNIIAFNDELLSFSSYLVQATVEMVENATKWMSTNVVAKGGTDLMHPLNEAISLLSGVQDLLPQIFLVTDGCVEDERNICATMRMMLMNGGSISPRISTFGIGSYCNHYFLHLLASIARGHYGAAYDPDSIENRMTRWFRKALSPMVANVAVDAFDHLEEYEIYQLHLKDISVNCPLFISGRYRGKFPDSLKAKGYLADMSEIVIDLTVQNTKEIPLEKVFGKQQIDLLTAQAWFSESKQLEKKVTQLSIQSSISSEYTYMVLLQTDSEKLDTGKLAKKSKSQNHAGPNERLPYLVRDLTMGFGNIAATVENLPTGFGEPKPPDSFDVINKAVSCCSRFCCCMCLIRACSKLNDQCFIVMSQLCGALSCLACSECCTELCCNGSN
ncbi:uncharacterized protein [Typha latifolia]|uniref:uncharacterized protein isoform X1 n=1 Tax=Typha latifolia TaxID=4733 RepID=UPI003C2F45A5